MRFLSIFLSKCSSNLSILVLHQRRNIQKTVKSSRKMQNPSAGRNSQPILEVLKEVLDPNRNDLKLLEISSGTGQHSSYFAKEFKNITFQPSEIDLTMFDSIKAYASSHKNMLEPISIDIREDFTKWEKRFEKQSFDYMLNINMLHISQWKCAEGLFESASHLLKDNGLLITYGPYAVNGLLTPESNVRFNSMLKSQNSQWGVRDVEDLKKLADAHNIALSNSYEMPSNNKTLIWQKIQKV